MMTDKSGSVQNAKATPKKYYVTPKLTTFGNVEQLTQAKTEGPSDGGRSF